MLASRVQSIALVVVSSLVPNDVEHKSNGVMYMSIVVLVGVTLCVSLSLYLSISLSLHLW